MAMIVSLLVATNEFIIHKRLNHYVICLPTKLLRALIHKQIVQTDPD